MSGIINQIGAKSGIISGGGTASAGTVTLSGTTGLDYEEGTFTASLSASTPPTSIPTAAGHYRLIGGICHFNIRRFNGVDTSGASGSWKITGLPFSPVVSCIIGGSCWTYNMSFSTDKYQVFEVDVDNDTLFAKEGVHNGAWQNWDIGSVGATRYISISGSYIIN